MLPHRHGRPLDIMALGGQAALYEAGKASIVFCNEDSNAMRARSIPVTALCRFHIVLGIHSNLAPNGMRNGIVDSMDWRCGQRIDDSDGFLDSGLE